MSMMKESWCDWTEKKYQKLNEGISGIDHEIIPLYKMYTLHDCYFPCLFCGSWDTEMLIYILRWVFWYDVNNWLTRLQINQEWSVLLWLSFFILMCCLFSRTLWKTGFPVLSQFQFITSGYDCIDKNPSEYRGNEQNLLNPELTMKVIWS